MHFSLCKCLLADFAWHGVSLCGAFRTHVAERWLNDFLVIKFWRFLERGLIWPNQLIQVYLVFSFNRYSFSQKELSLADQVNMFRLITLIVQVLVPDKLYRCEKILELLKGFSWPRGKHRETFQESNHICLRFFPDFDDKFLVIFTD